MKGFRSEDKNTIRANNPEQNTGKRSKLKSISKVASEFASILR